MGSYAFAHESSRVVVDLAGQVLKAELDEERSYDEPKTLASCVKDAGIHSGFVPLLALVAKAKRFDDELVASLDLLSHAGAAEHPSIASVCDQLRVRLPENTAIRGLFEAAHHLVHGTRPELGGGDLHTRKWLASFARDPKQSKPIGIYDGHPLLEPIFRHDRILQSEVSGADGALVREVLEREPAIAAAYRRHLDLVVALTGPLARASVAEAGPGPGKYAVLPASDSLESQLVRELFAHAPIPDGFELVPELITRIRDGRLRTDPSAKDAWYLHQFHASAALLAPETPGLVVGPRYTEHLEESFKALFALNRETHVKQLDLPGAIGRPPLYIQPRVTVEPLPELYARMASAYRHVRERLAAFWSDGVLRSIETSLVEMELLFRGAEVTSRFELAQPEDTSMEAKHARAVFERWRSSDDPALSYDLRVAVPVYYDVERKTVRIAATIGIETKRLRFDFAKKPRVRVHGEPTEPEFKGIAHDVLSLLMIEYDVPTPPTRNELRAICDREKTPAAIKAALVAK